MKKQTSHLIGIALAAIMIAVPLQTIPNAYAAQTTSLTIPSSGTIIYEQTPIPTPTPTPNNFAKSISYFSPSDIWKIDNSTLNRDFTRFKNDGIDIVNLAVHWYKIEKTRGNYSDTLLDGVKRATEVANSVGLKVRICLLVSMDNEGLTPTYAIDPVTGKHDGLAIIRSDDVRTAFLAMYNYTTAYLAKEPIWGWTIFGEPWYYPRTLDPPYNAVNQKENFITLYQELSALVKSRIGSGTVIDVNFISTHIYTKPDGSPGYETIFEKDWGWDARIFSCVDEIRFVYSPFEAVQKFPNSTVVYATYASMVKANVDRCVALGKPVFLTLQTDGGDDNNDAVQQSTWRQMMIDIKDFQLAGSTAYAWRSANYGTGMNLCGDSQGNPRPAYFEFINF
jgi:hypothetical protein